MKNIMKKAVICGVVLSMASLFAFSSVRAEDVMKPISDTTGTVLYPYHFEKKDKAGHYKAHNGIDILYDEYTTIKAPFEGKVVDSGRNIMGAYIVIADEKKGDAILISNLHIAFSDIGYVVKAGEDIGVTGMDYIHVSYYPNGTERNETADPTPLLTMNGTKLNFDKAE